MTDTQNLKVGSEDAIEVVAPDPVWATVTNLGPNSAYYDDAASVSSTSNDGTLAAGSSLSFRATKFFVSAGRSRLVVEVPDRLSWVEQQVSVFDPDSVGTPDGIVFGADTNLYRSAANVLKTDDAFTTASLLTAGPAGFAGQAAEFIGFIDVTRNNGSGGAIRVTVDGDAAFRFQVFADGDLAWGDGAGGADTTLVRDGAGIAKFNNHLRVGVTFEHQGTGLGVFGTSPTTKKTVTGSRGGNAALASLLTQLASYGLITDSSSA